MKKILVLAVLAVALIATPTMAKEGPYLGGSLIYNSIQSNDFDYLDAGKGFNFRFGYNFGSIALEGNLMKSTHDDTDPGYGDADFTGFSVDLKLYFSEMHDPNQVYFLVGLGSYKLEEYDPFALFGPTDVAFLGGGFNLGAGLEHRFNEQVALNVAGIYRFIEYDEIEAYGLSDSLNPKLDGDVFTIEVGLNLYF